MKKWSKEYLQAHKEDAGFYIILLICLAVICISGYVLFFAQRGDETGATAVVPYTGTAILPRETGGTARMPTVKPVEQPETKKTEMAVETPEKKEPVRVRPVAGDLVQPFTDTELVYNETLGDWRVHPAADYAAEPGDRVYAMTDAVVQSITQDDLRGTQITLKLGDGKLAVYSGLAEKVKVREEQDLRAGDVIGTIGENTDVSEAALGSHLHLAVYADGTAVDPERVLRGESVESPKAASFSSDDSTPTDGIYAEE